MADDPYQLHILNSLGLPETVIDLYCDGEAAAIERAKQLRNGRDVEIWHKDKRIALLKLGAKLN